MQHDFMIAQDDWREMLTPCEVRVTKGAKWLRPIALWLVRKFGMLDVRRDRVRTFRVATGETLLDRMHLQQRDMLRIYNREATTVFVGPEVFGEVHREVRNYEDLYRSTHPIALNTEVKLAAYSTIVVRGIKVVLIPWMSGALLVPGTYKVEEHA